MTVPRDHRTISIADQIFAQLQNDILTGKYERGEILNESRLSEELGVSRTPIREALRRLQQDHIVVDTSRGSSVVGISPEDMLDMYDIRVQLEGQAAARAAKNITDEELAQMREILDLQKFYIDKDGDMESKKDHIRDQDSRFHDLLFRATHSIVYYDTLSGIHRKITKFRRVSINKKSRAQESYDEHIAIYDALSMHEPELARARTVRHIINARDNIMNRIREESEEKEA